MTETIWLVIGFSAQGCFAARFGYQWVVSELKGESTIPLGFWYFSIAGGAGLLAYSIYRQEVVFIVGQSFGILVYLRNLYLVLKKKNLEGQSR